MSFGSRIDWVTVRSSVTAEQAAALRDRLPEDIGQALGLREYEAWSGSPGTAGREWRVVKPAHNIE